MRTTISIDDQLLEAAKRKAKSRGVTLGEYVEDALRLVIAGPSRAARKPLKFPVFAGGSGLRPGIDPSSNTDLFDALDEDIADSASGFVSANDVGFRDGHADIA